MDDVDRRVIQIYTDILANETNFKDLLEKLALNENIITPNLKEKYKKLQENGTTTYALNEELYKDIQTRGGLAFNTLVQGLKEVHPHLAELLEPNERVTAPSQEEEEEEEDDNENEPELTEYKGVCTLVGNQQNKSQIIHSVRKLCLSISAKFVSDDRNLTQANFHLAIKINGKFQERDIKTIESLYRNHSNLKIIIINIISEITDNSVAQPASKVERSTGSTPSAVFIVNVYIHPRDHVPSVINIIREVVANNRGYEIRDIFRVVMEKLTKWCCKLNTESRSFPEFYF